MTVIIIEDEISAVENMQALLKEIDNDIQILANLESVEEACQWIQENNSPDLAFMDIQLSDGTSFEIFDNVEVIFPVVFTTAYNEFALKAFKVNSIDYILKPIKKQDVEIALNKFKHISEIYENKPKSNINDIIQNIKTEVKRNLLIRKHDSFMPLPVASIAFININNGIVTAYSYSLQRYILHDKLDDLEKQLPQNEFFRANRQCIISRNSIAEAKVYFGGKLLLKTKPEAPFEIMISKAKVKVFKRWLEH